MGSGGQIPDIHHIAPVYEAELHAVHGSRWADLFALHYTLDRPAVRARYEASLVGAILLFLGAIALVAVLDAAALTRYRQR